MAHDLPTKLLVTQELLGCSSRKELCARFREVNPRTEFDLERSHKWMRGLAKPRSTRVYDDWVKLLRTDRAATWLVACTIDAFVEEVCRIFAADPLELRRRVDNRARQRLTSQATGVHYLCGAYAVYSRAWSPYYLERVIRGSLVIEQGRGARFAGRYCERLPSGPIELAGTGGLVGRVLHLALHEPGSGAPLYFSVLLSGIPASVLSGIMSGATMAGPDPLPSSSRVALVRVPAGKAEELDSSNSYLAADPAALGVDFASLGLSLAEMAVASAELWTFLMSDNPPALSQVGQTAHARLAEVFDPVEQ